MQTEFARAWHRHYDKSNTKSNAKSETKPDNESDTKSGAKSDIRPYIGKIVYHKDSGVGLEATGRNISKNSNLKFLYWLPKDFGLHDGSISAVEEDSEDMGVCMIRVMRSRQDEEDGKCEAEGNTQLRKIAEEKWNMIREVRRSSNKDKQQSRSCSSTKSLP